MGGGSRCNQGVTVGAGIRNVQVSGVTGNRYIHRQGASAEQGEEIVLQPGAQTIGLCAVATTQAGDSQFDFQNGDRGEVQIGRAWVAIQIRTARSAVVLVFVVR